MLLLLYVILLLLYVFAADTAVVAAAAYSFLKFMTYFVWDFAVCTSDQGLRRLLRIFAISIHKIALACQ